jgi:hypothetical protein
MTLWGVSSKFVCTIIDKLINEKLKIPLSFLFYFYKGKYKVNPTDSQTFENSIAKITSISMRMEANSNNILYTRVFNFH